MKSNLNRWIPEKEYISIFRQKILKWHDRHGRTYPWRTTHDPFRVLIAEMMLRRTKADQVKTVYQKIFKLYPDIKSFSNANIKDLREILYPLGLKWRIPSFKKVACILKTKYRGKVPPDRNELKSLPGVGEYVAGAILSIAYNKKEWIVDSNVVRVFSRYFGIKTSKEGRRDAHVIELAKKYVSSKSPRKSNLALLDFTSLVCKPSSPQCTSCPLVDACSYYTYPRKHISNQRQFVVKC